MDFLLSDLVEDGELSLDFLCRQFLECRQHPQGLARGKDSVRRTKFSFLANVSIQP